MYFCVWLCGFQRVLDQFPYCRWSHKGVEGVEFWGWEYHTTDNQYHSPFPSVLLGFPHSTCKAHRWAWSLAVASAASADGRGGFLLAGMSRLSCFIASLLVMRDRRNGHILPSVRLVSVLIQVVVNFKGFSHLMCGVIRSACRWLLELRESGLWVSMFCCYNSLVCVPTPAKAFCPPNVSLNLRNSIFFGVISANETVISYYKFPLLCAPVAS